MDTMPFLKKHCLSMVHYSATNWNNSVQLMCNWNCSAQFQPFFQELRFFLMFPQSYKTKMQLDSSSEVQSLVCSLSGEYALDSSSPTLSLMLSAQ